MERVLVDERLGVKYTKFHKVRAFEGGSRGRVDFGSVWWQQTPLPSRHGNMHWKVANATAAKKSGEVR